MKNKKFFSLFCFALFAEAFIYSATKTSAKGNVIFGLTPLEISASGDSPAFGGAYFAADVSLSNEYLTAGGKIYYRLGAGDAFSELSQKLEIKKAYVSIRPFGNNVFEVSCGKLYSYYLSGNFFQLAEIYTGSSRWGKSGVGLQFKHAGFSAGLALPLSESYVKFSDEFGINAALAYDFSELNEALALKAGTSLLYKHEKKEAEPDLNDFSSTLSLNYAPAIKDSESFISKPNLTLSFSINSEPYVASSVFKNVSNYKNSDLKKANFASLNFRCNFKEVQVILEGEAGHSTEGSMIPLYAGLQLNIPFIQFLSFKPRFFYYAAVDTADSSAGRSSFEIYPRFIFSFKSWTISAGADLKWKESGKSEYLLDWSLPLYLEYKF